LLGRKKYREENKTKIKQGLKEYYLKTRIKCPDCGKLISKESKKCQICLGKERRNEKNPAWKGNDVGYIRLHIWLRKVKPKPEICELCKIKEPEDMANIKNHIYTRNTDDYKWLCKSCHNKLDRACKEV